MLSDIAKKVLDFFIDNGFDREDWVCWGSALSEINAFEEMYDWLQKQETLTVELIDEKIEEMLFRD